MTLFLLPVSLIVLAGCSEQQNPTAGRAGAVASPPKAMRVERWYTREQVMRGNVLFQANCAVCHKPDASSTPNWREPDAQGKYPPPPLNGTAHTWHHPLSILRRTVRNGGVPLGGAMPGFADKLKPDEIDDILAWVQSHWSDKIYGTWSEINTQARKAMQPIKKG
jgi:mono/diheme cytochrome c family protein